MCGLAGFFGKGDRRDLERMTASLAHRGPNDEAFWADVEKRLFLGHRRLSVLDHAGGRQPMWTADGQLAIVFNGEIYNHAELRRELSGLGHVFRSDHSDTETLLYAYRQWGADLHAKLNGMWAFVIYDKAEDRLFCSRDRFGQKPFYYTHSPGLFAFSSELLSLAEHGEVGIEADMLSLQKYFALGFIPAPCSLFRGVSKLPAGHFMIFNLRNEELTIRRYWEFVLEPMTDIPKNPEEVWGDRIRELLDQAVQRRLVSDVPLGVFLSGGMDSSAVAAFARRTVPDLHTFSIGFEHASFDERAFSKPMAERLQTQHHERVMDDETAQNMVFSAIGHLDEPLGDSSMVATALLCRFAAEEITVALGGDGADELFAGYDPFLALRRAEWYRRLVPKPVHRAIRLLAGKIPVSHDNLSGDFRVKKTLQGLSVPRALQLATWMAPMDYKEVMELLEEPVPHEELYAEAIDVYEDCKAEHPVDQALQYFTKLYLQNGILTKIDRAGMAFGLEVRSPFLDIDLVNFARTIPHQYKYRRGKTKYILKKALAPVLPSEIINRPKKGFGIPLGHWLRETEVEIPAPLVLPIFNRKYVEDLFWYHLSGQKDHRLFLWNYLTVAQFFRMKRVTRNGFSSKSI